MDPMALFHCRSVGLVLFDFHVDCVAGELDATKITSPGNI